MCLPLNSCFYNSQRPRIEATDSVHLWKMWASRPCSSSDRILFLEDRYLLEQLLSEIFLIVVPDFKCGTLWVCVFSEANPTEVKLNTYDFLIM